MDKQAEFVLRTIEERDIRFVRLWFTDVLGTLKSVAVAPAELEGAFAEGLGFDGSAIEGFARVGTHIGPVVILCLLFSLIETKLILPAHLRNLRVDRPASHGFLGAIERLQRYCSAGMLPACRSSMRSISRSVSPAAAVDERSLRLRRQ